MKISLYKERTMSECLEATFDFLRANRRVWFRTVLLLFLPISMLSSILLFSSMDTDMIDNHEVDFWMKHFFDNVEKYSLISIVIMFVSSWIIYVQVYSLVLANEESADGVEGMSLKQLKPWFIRAAQRSWYLPLVFAALLLPLFVPFLNFLIVICLVPLALLPALHVVGRLSIVEALMKSLSLGFPIWFKLFFNIVLISLLGFYVFLVLFLPTLFLQMMLDSFSISQLHELEWLFVFTMGFVFTVLAFLGWFIVQSMVVLLCTFHYGSSSEEMDASSLEGEVANFGK